MDFYTGLALALVVIVIVFAAAVAGEEVKREHPLRSDFRPEPESYPCGPLLVTLFAVCAIGIAVIFAAGMLLFGWAGGLG